MKRQKTFILLIINLLLSTHSWTQIPVKGVNYISYQRGQYPTAASWQPQLSDGIRAIQATQQGTFRPLSGPAALEMDVHLIGGDAHQASGEVFVDMRNCPPASETGQCFSQIENLSQQTLTAYVYCPAEAMGNPTNPNGLQLFVKDHQWRSFYGTVVPIARAGEWLQVTVTPRREAPVDGYIDQGFDPTQVIAIGLKIGAHDTWRGVFEGKIWLDEVSWGNDHKRGYPFTHPEDAIHDLAAIHANYASLLVTWYMDDINAHSLYRHAHKTHSDEEIIATIRKMKANGLEVMLKPQVDVIDDTWRGMVKPDDVAQWFDVYTAFITHYARIAEAEKVALFCVGTEFNKLDGKYKSEWNQVIEAIKAEYGGLLTYAANWDHYKRVCFWDQMDLIGIDAYFPLSPSANPPLNDLLEGWKPWQHQLIYWHERMQKDILFTEIGYSSREYTADNPWDNCWGGWPCDYAQQCELQATCYEAALQTFGSCDWFQGLFVWGWQPVADAGGCCDRNFTPQNKVGATTLASWFHPDSAKLGDRFHNAYHLAVYPNPTREVTTITYNVPLPQHLLLKVIDLEGKLCAVLVDEVQATGAYQVTFDPEGLVGGVYLVVVQGANGTEGVKLVVE